MASNLQLVGNGLVWRPGVLVWPSPGVLVSWSIAYPLLWASWCFWSGVPGVLVSSGLPKFLVSWSGIAYLNRPGVVLVSSWSGHETNTLVRAVLAKNESCCLPTHFDISAGQRVFPGQRLFDPLMKTIAVVVTVGLSIGFYGVSPKKFFGVSILNQCRSEPVFIPIENDSRKIGD